MYNRKFYWEENSKSLEYDAAVFYVYVYDQERNNGRRNVW